MDWVIFKQLKHMVKVHGAVGGGSSGGGFGEGLITGQILEEIVLMILHQHLVRWSFKDLKATYNIKIMLQ